MHNQMGKEYILHPPSLAGYITQRRPSQEP